MSALFCWLGVAALIAYVIFSHIRHVMWRREGLRLNKQFDALMQWRADYLDPVVAQKRDVEQSRWLFVELELFFQRCERHTEQRQRHLDSWRWI